MRKLLLSLAGILAMFLMACQPPEQEASGISADNLLDYQVVNQDGEVVGELEKVLLDANDQTISHGVVRLSTRPLGYKGAWASARSVTVPWSHLTLDVDGERFILVRPLESSQAAPVYLKAAGIAN
jgi:sporulation protein YlmC with PRC-barrel domain